MSKLFVNAETNQDTLEACGYMLWATNDYIQGATAPHYPLPVVSDSDPTMRAIKDLSQWLSNSDGWWNS